MFSDIVPNWIDGREQEAADGGHFTKVRPADGTNLAAVARSRVADVNAAVAAAKAAQPN